ncbi:MAG TPA: hypothetical protein DF409_01800 [Bacteroidales bacterium]|nr:hypothetical protein [Bacteroidales bacterium]
MCEIRLTGLSKRYPIHQGHTCLFSIIIHLNPDKIRSGNNIRKANYGESANCSVKPGILPCERGRWF